MREIAPGERIIKLEISRIEVPVCIDDPEQILDGGLLTEWGFSHCWRPSRESSSLPGSGILAALSEGVELKAIPSIVEILLEWSEGGNRAGLFLLIHVQPLNRQTRGKFWPNCWGRILPIQGVNSALDPQGFTTRYLIKSMVK